MLVHKCDKCKKVIPTREKSAILEVDISYDRYEFCRTCGKRIADMVQLTLNS